MTRNFQIHIIKLLTAEWKNNHAEITSEKQIIPL